MNIRGNIEQWLGEVKGDLISQYNNMGLRASGQWEQGLETIVTQTDDKYNATILGEAYTGVLVSGRKPNTDQDPESLRRWVGWAGSTFLKEWAQRKGVQASPFAVAWKIAREGVKVPNAHNAGGFVTAVITDARIRDLLYGISGYMISQVRSDVIKTIKQN